MMVCNKLCCGINILEKEALKDEVLLLKQQMGVIQSKLQTLPDRHVEQLTSMPLRTLLEPDLNLATKKVYFWTTCGFNVLENSQPTTTDTKR